MPSVLPFPLYDFGLLTLLQQHAGENSRGRFERLLLGGYRYVAERNPLCVTPVRNSLTETSARSMIAVIQDTNGTMTLEDLASYEVKSRKVSRTTYRGIELYGISSPAGGAVSLSNLKTMAQYASHDLAADGNLTVHRFDEAMRFAYGARMELGDPDFVPYVENLEAEMLDEKHAKLIKDRILDNQTQAVESYNPKRIYTTDGHGTSHIVTADGAGMATSLTTTINLIFGAQIMDPDSGVIMYAAQPHRPNLSPFVPLSTRTGSTQEKTANPLSSQKQRNERLFHPRRPQRVRL